MDIQRRKLWGDRITWALALAATVVVVTQYVTRGGAVRLYLLIGWGAIMAFLVFFTELRIGRRRPEPGPEGFFAGVASYIGEELVEPDGRRKRAWVGTVPGTLEVGQAGVEWSGRDDVEGPDEVRVGWEDFWSWRIRRVIPVLPRASGYLVLRRRADREHVFHVPGVGRWHRALREAAIIGPTSLRPAWLQEAVRAGPPTQPPPVAGRKPAPVSSIESTAAAAPVQSAGATESVEPAPAGHVEPAAQTVSGNEQAPLADPAPVSPAPHAWEPVIGLECHVELATDSKVFCGCPTGFGAAPNTQICPVCTGQPGSLPVVNEKAVEYALRIAVALNCRVATQSLFHRKNYFYPDMPKNYQISQYDVPLASEGWLDVEVDGEPRRIRINRVHLEEDTGKTTHKGASGRIGGAEYALVDYNRAGVPLVEIVTEPDIATPEEARAYVTELRGLLSWIGVSDVRMEEGSLRCDANVSVRPAGAAELGVKVEVKNMNSIRSVHRALEFEIDRLTALAREGELIVQETRHFDESVGRTIAGRSKEYTEDYRYFPDPDLVPLAPGQAWIERIRTSLPELPAARRRRLADHHSLPEAAARSVTASRELADAFERAVGAYGGPGQPIARWYLGELARLGNDRERPPESLVAPESVAELQRLIDDGTVSDTAAKTTILTAMVESGRSPSQIVRDEGLQATDASELERIIDQVLDANPDVVESVRSGKEGAVGPLIGQVLKASGNAADPKRAREMLLERIAGAR